MYEKIETTVQAWQTLRDEISQQLDISAMEALIIIFSVLIDGQVDRDDVDSEQVSRWEATIKKFNLTQFNPAQKRQVFQLVVVGAMMADKLQANYQITPDAIGMWIGFVVKELGSNYQLPLHITDLGFGTGNLAATVTQVLEEDQQVELRGIENDDTMLTIASGLMNLLDEQWQLDFADAITLEKKASTQIVIGDLPVGYYPNRDIEGYQVYQGNEEKLPYVHHLLIEKALKMLDEDGVAILLVPAQLFESEQAPALLNWLQTNDVYLQAILQFSTELFANTAAMKHVLILQKPGQHATQAEPVLLAQIPQLTDKEANEKFIAEFDRWFKNNPSLKIQA
ncbi:class I SAM-dependent methyltransferase [Weissella kandleri]|uniref:class I SAM-dependent methyltransferase n=1 Tax=Weissella kandleri TaxID=1616 RepID=UPI00387E94DD